MSLRVSRHWTLPYWLAAAALFVLAWSRQWGPEPSTAATLLLHLAASAGEMLVVQLLLGHPRPILAKQLAAVLLATLATAFWAARATPSGPGIAVVHVIWLMLLVVLLAGRLGWTLFIRILHRPRR